MMCAAAAFIAIAWVSFNWFTTTQPRYIDDEPQNGAAWFTLAVEALNGLLWWVALINHNRRSKRTKELEREIESRGLYVRRYASAPPEVRRAPF